MQRVDERPMPRADPVTVRSAAAQAAAVAAELQRLRDQLTGASAHDGWTGAARLAFDENLAARIALFDPIIDRYDSYAASLITYARDLEQVLPGLRNARFRLDNAPPGSDGKTPADAELDFNRLWQGWDAARRRCVAGLETAGRIGADRHGLSAFWHRATHAAHEVVSHVNLAEISKVLSDLGDVLFVAALVLSPVPGLGEVLWAAVAVVAVMKFAVDGTRYANGDKSVSRADLAWDAAGALPGGKVAKTAKEAAKAARIAKDGEEVEEGTSEFANVQHHALEQAPQSPTVPGGLTVHERAGGHVLERHVGKTDEDLAQRFVDNPKLMTSSTFFDRETAERCLGTALDDKSAEIEAWLAGSGRRKEFDVFTKEFVGRSMTKTTMNAEDVSNFHVSLWRDPKLPWGYRAHTAFPMP